jgi:PAS domain-containing protein
MHYLGMWALDMPGRITWATDLVAASIVLGVLFGAAALTIASRRDTVVNANVAAAVLALAIVSHHFTAMGAVEIVPEPIRTAGLLSVAPLGLALGIGNAAIAVLGMSIVASMMDRRLRNQSTRTLVALNNMPHGLCMFDSKKRLVLCNEGYAELYRLPPELLKAGTTHDAIIAHRVSSGLLAGERRRCRQEEDCEFGCAVGDGEVEPDRQARRWAPDLCHAAANARRRLGRHARGHYRAAAARRPARKPGRPGTAPCVD